MPWACCRAADSCPLLLQRGGLGVFAYVGKSLGGSILHAGPRTCSGKARFGRVDRVADAGAGLAVGGGAAGGGSIITLWRASRGIEAVTKRLTPLLFVLLIAVAIASLSLPGAMERVRLPVPAGFVPAERPRWC